MKKQNAENVTRDRIPVSKNRNPASRTAKQPHESRVGWTICYPARKREAWQADYLGVVSLNGEKHWVKILSDATGYALRLRAKDRPATGSCNCRLEASPTRKGSAKTQAHLPSSQHAGTLQLAEQTFRVRLSEDASENGLLLRIHFELEGGAA